MKISDAEKITGICAQTIRYYEGCGLLSVKRGENSYRDYDCDSINTLKKIRMLRELGIAVADIRLWRDEVVTLGELVNKRLRELDENNRLSGRQQKLCEAILQNSPEPDYLTSDDESYVEKIDESEPPEDDILSLGVDIGTTTVSAQLISLRDGRSYHTYSITYDAAVNDEVYPDAYAMDAGKLLDRALGLVRSAAGAYPGIRAIGFAGQMHGIVCLGEDGSILTPLYTWQNSFGLRKNEAGKSYCDEIYELTGEKVPSGYGLATYYCLGKMKLLPENTAMVATIMDLAVMRLCGNKKTLTHTTNAASLGFFDITSRVFNSGSLQKLGIDSKILPDVTSAFNVAGYYLGIPVAAAIGDNQAGMFGSLQNERQFLINVGTSAQVSVICGDSSLKTQSEIRPYIGDKYIVSGAALCGGRAYSALADFFILTAEKLCGARLSKNKVYELMNLEAKLHMDDKPEDGELKIDTRFCGTRRDTSIRGSATNLGLFNFTPEQFICGTLRGIVGELYEMYREMPDTCGEKRIPVLSGNAMRRNEMLRNITGEIFGETPLVPVHIEEAAYGAALFGAICAGIIDQKQASELIKYQ